MYISPYNIRPSHILLIASNKSQEYCELYIEHLTSAFSLFIFQAVQCESDTASTGTLCCYADLTYLHPERPYLQVNTLFYLP